MEKIGKEVSLAAVRMMAADFRKKSPEKRREVLEVLPPEWKEAILKSV